MVMNSEYSKARNNILYCAKQHNRLRHYSDSAYIKYALNESPLNKSKSYHTIAARRIHYIEKL